MKILSSLEGPFQHSQDDHYRYIEVFEATSRDVERAKMSMERGGGGGGYGRGGGGGGEFH